MRRFFNMDLENQWTDLENRLIAKVRNIDFHTSNYAVAEEVASYFTNNNYLQNFDCDFLDNVYGILIGPAKEFGYYDVDMPEPEEGRMYRTSSAFQYGGDDARFRFACTEILNAIAQERDRRVALEIDHIPPL